MMELKANPQRNAEGIVIESKLDRGRGPVATVLVRNGTLKVGDTFVVGHLFGKIRALRDDKHIDVESALPGIPVEILGLSDVPHAGDMLSITNDEKTAKTIALHRYNQNKEGGAARKLGTSLEEIYSRIEEGKIQTLPIIIKADTQGSSEALEKAYTELSNEKIKITIIHTGVGAISESDVLLAGASHAIIVGFNVRPEAKAKAFAESQKIDIKTYGIIYDAINGIKDALSGALLPIKKEEVIGHTEVRGIFTIPKIGVIAGCHVNDGRIARNSLVRLLRDNIVIYEGTLQSLRRFKDDVKEVTSGYECGLSIQNYNDIKVGDVIEAYVIKEVRELL
jgi:translation initiation factor IF-2